MITLGVIGAGIMGERMLRAALEQASELVRVTGIWDPSAEALARIGGLAPHAGSAASLIAGADCVYIASPPASHLDHARAALAARKAVFCEKPLAVDIAAGAAFVAALGSGRAAVNFPMASSLAVATLRDWLDGIGTPRLLLASASERHQSTTWPSAASQSRRPSPSRRSSSSSSRRMGVSGWTRGRYHCRRAGTAGAAPAGR